MKSNYRLAFAAAAFLAFGSLGYANDEHHPASASATAKVAPKTAVKPAAKAAPKESKEQAAKMDKQMQAMRDMHNKMMNAKTPEERQALMAEHMKTMRDGMSVMSSMMGKESAGKQMPSPEMMQKEMDMMQMMTDMMKDRMGPSSSTKMGTQAPGK